MIALHRPIPPWDQVAIDDLETRQHQVEQTPVQEKSISDCFIRNVSVSLTYQTKNPSISLSIFTIAVIVDRTRFS
jgi:hypothetical protein